MSRSCALRRFSIVCANSFVRVCTSSNRRTFSIAIDAWSAKLRTDFDLAPEKAPAPPPRHEECPAHASVTFERNRRDQRRRGRFRPGPRMRNWDPSSTSGMCTVSRQQRAAEELPYPAGTAMILQKIDVDAGPAACAAIAASHRRREGIRRR